MPLSTQEMLDLVDTKIEGLINSPEVDYKIGDKTVSASDKMKQLLELRAELIAAPDADISVIAFDFDISEFGEDDSQVED